MAILLIGYDIEGSRFENGESTMFFFEQIVPFHLENKIPCTLFLLGKTLEMFPDEFKEISAEPLFELAYHTYNHISLKSVRQKNKFRDRFVPGASLEEIERDTAKSTELFLRLFKNRALGLCGPNQYYRGLSDRPDILRILHEQGIRYTRTYGLNKDDWQPVPLSVQPFRYEVQGFPDMLEIPTQAWQDWYWWEVHGWHKVSEYIDYFRGILHKVKKGEKVLSWCLHDVTMARDRRGGTVLAGGVSMATDFGFEILTHAQLYQRYSKEANYK